MHNNLIFCSLLILQVNLKFNPEFHNSWVMGMTYNVRFGINRSVFSFMHVRLRQRCPTCKHDITHEHGYR